MNVNVPAVVSNLFGGKKEETSQDSTSTSQSSNDVKNPSPSHQSESVMKDTGSNSNSTSQFSSDSMNSKDPKSSPQFGSATNNTSSTKSDPVSRDTKAGLTEMEESEEKRTNTAVQHEHIKKTHEEKTQEVVDKERHQDHYHTTIQPLKDSEVKPEEHNYKEAATENRSFNHEDSAETKAKLEAEKARFQNTVDVGATAESKTTEGAVAGEDKIIHHHHEIVQPVIEKKTVKPSVTHTTIPVKETHHDASVIHETSTAKAMSVDDFRNAGNKLNTADEAAAEGEKVGIQPIENA